MIRCSLPEITIHFTDPWQRSLSPTTITIRQLLSEWGLFSVQSVHCRDSLISEKKIETHPSDNDDFSNEAEVAEAEALTVSVAARRTTVSSLF